MTSPYQPIEYHRCLPQITAAIEYNAAVSQAFAISQIATSIDRISTKLNDLADRMSEIEKLLLTLNGKVVKQDQSLILQFSSIKAHLGDLPKLVQQHFELALIPEYDQEPDSQPVTPCPEARD
jgi:hypothetical protein